VAWARASWLLVGDLQQIGANYSIFEQPLKAIADVGPDPQKNSNNISKKSPKKIS